MPERSAQEWMRFAWPHLGAHEAPGSRINPVIAAMYRDSGHGGIKDDAVPWCAAFVGAVLARAGMTSTGSLRARSYLDWGVAVDDPITGAVAVLSRGKNPALGHVGFVVGATATELFLLGGNQSNRVSVGRFARSRLLGLRLPEGARAPARDVAGDDRFDDCLAHVLDMEGGYSNDPHDPGGPTNKGITLATYARFRRTPLTRSNRDALISDLQVISNDDVKDIYRRRYWNVSRAAEMGAGVDLIHFDATVNHGATGAAKLVQATVGVAVDGEIGPIT
ncbi:MAG: TIGR02594 family protein, partial [Pseudomonadota bacterium]